jgi:hypothetical protein
MQQTRDKKLILFVDTAGNEADAAFLANEKLSSINSGVH